MHTIDGIYRREMKAVDSVRTLPKLSKQRNMQSALTLQPYGAKKINSYKDELNASLKELRMKKLES